MTCEEARRILLDAELEALEGTSDDRLGQHLRDCAACRGSARAILAHADELRDAIDLSVGAHASAAAAARAARRALDERIGESPPLAARRARARRVAIRTVPPLLAAAALAALLFGVVPGVRSPLADTPVPGFYVPEPRVPDRPVVNVTTRGGVAVMRTTDPLITVVWNF